MLYDSREEKFYPANYQQLNVSSSEPPQRRILYTELPLRHSYPLVSLRIHENDQHTHPASPQQRHKLAWESRSNVLGVIRESKDYPGQREPRFSNANRYRGERYTKERNDTPSIFYNHIKQQINHIYPPPLTSQQSPTGKA